jgi:hypothetical protein
MYAKAPSTVLQRAMHIHPKVAIFVPTLMGDLRSFAVIFEHKVGQI